MKERERKQKERLSSWSRGKGVKYEAGQMKERRRRRKTRNWEC